MRALHTVVYLAFLTSSALAQQAQESQSVSVGPWKIATTYKADKFDNCIMSRTFADVEISFVRTKNGLSLLLDSQNDARRIVSGVERWPAAAGHNP